jgi:hypothetical protein
VVVDMIRDITEAQVGHDIPTQRKLTASAFGAGLSSETSDDTRQQTDVRKAPVRHSLFLLHPTFNHLSNLLITVFEYLSQLLRTHLLIVLPLG